MCCKFSRFQKITGAPGAQVASSNQVLTSMGWGVQGGGGGLVSGLTGKRPLCYAGTPKTTKVLRVFFLLTL